MSKGKVAKVMHEYKQGKLHSGSKSGPKVKSRKQAIAIGMSEARREGERVGARKGAKVGARAGAARERRLEGKAV
jgi:hypothetical protein